MITKKTALAVLARLLVFAVTPHTACAAAAPETFRALSGMNFAAGATIPDSHLLLVQSTADTRGSDRHFGKQLGGYSAPAFVTVDCSVARKADTYSVKALSFGTAWSVPPVR